MIQWNRGKQRNEKSPSTLPLGRPVAGASTATCWSRVKVAPGCSILGCSEFHCFHLSNVWRYYYSTIRHTRHPTGGSTNLAECASESRYQWWRQLALGQKGTILNSSDEPLRNPCLHQDNINGLLSVLNRCKSSKTLPTFRRVSVYECRRSRYLRKKRRTTLFAAELLRDHDNI